MKRFIRFIPLLLVVVILGVLEYNERKERITTKQRIQTLLQERGRPVQIADLPDGEYEMGIEIDDLNGTAIVWDHNKSPFQPLLVSHLPVTAPKGLLFHVTQKGFHMAVVVK